MSWTGTNPVTVGDPTKKKNYDVLWDNVDYIKTNVMSSGTVMLFGQNSPPTGWTRKTSWGQTGQRMFVYSTGNISTGGGMKATTGHTHTIANHNHQWYKYNVGSTGQSYDAAGSLIKLTTGGVAAGGIELTGTTHIGKDCYTAMTALSPSKTTAFKYQSVIAAVKDAYA